MPVDHKNRIAFVHIPRTGGQSLCEYWPMVVEDKHEPASKIKELYPDYFIFTIIRPDEDRLESASRCKVSDDEKMLPNSYFLDADIDLLIDYDHWNDSINGLRKRMNLQVVDFKQLDRAKLDIN